MSSCRMRVTMVLVCAMASLASTSAAQSNGGPMLPVPPAVVARDGEGQVVVRATRVAEAIVLDGRLDDPVYTRVTAIGDFVQQEPEHGVPATEKTDVWLMFDDRNIYISARCWDSHPEREVATEMRRDGTLINDNENFGVLLDTFYDRRNAFRFDIALAGGMSDVYVTDERNPNRDWNTVWDAKTARFDQGWTAEMVIPFASLRFKAGPGPVWGVNFRRVVRWKNEGSHLTSLPASLGRRAINQVSQAAMLVGLELPTKRNFEVKPYAIADVSTDRSTLPPVSNDPGGNAGLDVKVGLTQGLTADFTYNTDFAQVEVDQQVANLTRFSVLFPEKRDFFLEGQGIFTFGGVQQPNRGGVGPGNSGGANPSPDDVPMLFFSRRIGLNGGQKVPLDVGGRVTGKAGPYSIGLLDIRTGREPRIGVEPTNFATVRIKRDILRRSSIGALLTHRSLSSSGVGTNQALGIDGAFSFHENLNINAYVAKVLKAGGTGDDLSYRGVFDYVGDRYGLQLEHLFVDDRFDPDVGFLRRTAFRRSTAFARFSPRPKSMPSVRKLTWDATLDYTTDTAGRLESREAQTAFRSELQHGDNFSVEYAQIYEFLAKPFAIGPTVTIPAGSYSYPEIRLAYFFGPQRPASGIVKLTRGSFYDGTRTGISTFRGRMDATAQLSFEPGLSVDWIDLPAGRFTTTVFNTRTTFTLTPRASVSALMQYVSNTNAFGSNIRFWWEYRPGSDFFIVYTDNRDTLHPGFPALQNRAVIVKLTKLFRM